MRQLLNMKRAVAIFWPNTAHGKDKGQLSYVQQTGLPTISKEQPVTHIPIMPTTTESLSFLISFYTALTKYGKFK